MEGVSKVMIVDFDAHQVREDTHTHAHTHTHNKYMYSTGPIQGNGHERDFMGDERVFILDMYNRWIYPNDVRAKG